MEAKAIAKIKQVGKCYLSLIGGYWCFDVKTNTKSFYLELNNALEDLKSSGNTLVEFDNTSVNEEDGGYFLWTL